MPKVKKNKQTPKISAKKIDLSKDGKKLLFSPVKKNKLLHGRKFRQNPDLEAFYNFVHENNLRVEACEILFQLIEDRKRTLVKDKKRVTPRK